MVGILLSFWEGLFSGAMLVLGRVPPEVFTVFKRHVWGAQVPNLSEVALDA